MYPRPLQKLTCLKAPGAVCNNVLICASPFGNRHCRNERLLTSSLYICIDSIFHRSPFLNIHSPFFFFFWLCPRQVEVPGPGIKPMPQQWKCQILVCQATRELLNIHSLRPYFGFKKVHNDVYHVNWWLAGRKRFSSVTNPTWVQGLLFLITKLWSLIQLKKEEVVKGG